MYRQHHNMFPNQWNMFRKHTVPEPAEHVRGAPEHFPEPPEHVPEAPEHVP